jgi:hypothetical protein
MKRTGALGEGSVDGVQGQASLRSLKAMLPLQMARPALRETWRTRGGAGAALVTAALLMSACADASSTSGDAASAPSTQTSATANTVSNNDSPLTAKSQPEVGLATNVTNAASTTNATSTISGAPAASADQPASASRPSLELAKAKQLAAEQSVAGRVPSASDMIEKRSRPLTLRDSGIDGSLMFARDVDFRVTGDIGFLIHDMAATPVSRLCSTIRPA